MLMIVIFIRENIGGYTKDVNGGEGELSRTGRCVNANISQKMTACRRSAGSTRGSSLARGLTLLQARVIQRVVPHPVKVENIAKPQGQK